MRNQINEQTFDIFRETVRPILVRMRLELEQTHYDFHADVVDEILEELRGKLQLKTVQRDD